MTDMGYASRTRVPANQTRTDIETLLRRHGADHFLFTTAPETVWMSFQSYGRRVRFRLQVPDENEQPRQYRRRWRALLLTIKTKLASVACGVEEFEEAFLAQLVMPDGQTLSEKMQPQIQEAYDTGKIPDLSTLT